MTPLLATKLYVPPAPRGLVARTRLRGRLDQGARSTLTLLSAPAGFGKTTLLAGVAAGVDFDGSFTWVESVFLEEQGVQPWAGEDSLPLWLPRPEYDGMLAHEPAPAVAAGLALRPVADTAPGCLDSPVTALTPEREAEVLAAWHSRST